MHSVHELAAAAACLLPDAVITYHYGDDVDGDDNDAVRSDKVGV